MAEPVEVRADVVVDAAPEAVWAAITDWPRQGEWMPATTVRVTGPDPVGHSVGSTLEAFTGLGRVGLQDPMIITEWDPPRRCVVEHIGGTVRGTGVFEVLELPGGRSRFVWSEHLELATPVRWGLLAVRPVVGVGLGVALRRMARQVADG